MTFSMRLDERIGLDKVNLAFSLRFKAMAYEGCDDCVFRTKSSLEGA
jgi:hypothetical protein